MHFGEPKGSAFKGHVIATPHVHVPILVDMRRTPSLIDLELPTITMTSSHVRGEQEGVAFDFAIQDRTAPLFHYMKRFYEGRFPSSKLMSPMPNLVARGEARVGGRVWKIDGWRGLLGRVRTLEPIAFRPAAEDAAHFVRTARSTRSHFEAFARRAARSAAPAGQSAPSPRAARAAQQAALK